MECKAIRSVPYLVRNNLVVFLAIVLYLIRVGHGDGTMREEVYMAHRTNFSNDTVCSTGKPNQVIDRVRSKIECVLVCQETSECSGVNWKESSTCEMYRFDPQTFQASTGCIYLSPGEQFKFVLMYV